MSKKGTRFMAEAAMIAAIYAALTYAAAAVGLAYGGIQFRFSEALTILAAFTPAAIPGLTLGCFLGNLGSPYGMVDILCGTGATLLAAAVTYLLRNIRIKKVPVLAPLPPVLSNALIVGLEIAWFLPEGISWAGFLLAAIEVGIGELVVCYGLGLPLGIGIERTGIFKENKK